MIEKYEYMYILYILIIFVQSIFDIFLIGLNINISNIMYIATKLDISGYKNYF